MRLCMRACVRTAEPAPHRGIEAEVEGLDEDLAIFEVGSSGSRLPLLREGLSGDDVAFRPLGEVNGDGFTRHSGQVYDCGVKVVVLLLAFSKRLMATTCAL